MFSNVKNRVSQVYLVKIGCSRFHGEQKWFHARRFCWRSGHLAPFRAEPRASSHHHRPIRRQSATASRSISARDHPTSADTLSEPRVAAKPRCLCSLIKMRHDPLFGLWEGDSSPLNLHAESKHFNLYTDTLSSSDAATQMMSHTAPFRPTTRLASSVPTSALRSPLMRYLLPKT